MVRQELPQAWWFDSHNLARPSPWLANTLSELDDKTKQMLKLIDQDADSFAQRAEMYYKKRPVLVDMLGDLYRTHRSLAVQCDLLKHGNGASRHTVFGPPSCAQSLSQAAVNGKPASRCTSCSASCYDSESEVDDPEPEVEEEKEEHELVEEASETETKKPSLEEQVELMRAEIARLREQNAELQRVAEENAALKAELAGKDDEKREAIRQLASAFDMVREENSALRRRVKESKNSPSPPQQQQQPSRGIDLKKLARDVFSARLLFTARCRPTGSIVAL